jgi:peroxin-10
MASSSLPQFVLAPQPDVIRSLQKDEQFVSGFASETKELLTSVLGHHAALWEPEIDCMTRILYFVAPVLFGEGLMRKTLGEEYADILQMDGQHGSVFQRPSVAKQLVAVLLGTAVPYLYQRVLDRASRPDASLLLSSPAPWLCHPALSSSSSARALVARVRAWMHTVLSVVQSTAVSTQGLVKVAQQLHLCLFYLMGRYLTLSKRVVGVHYIFVRKLEYERPGYQVLGLLMMVQLLIAGIRQLKRLIRYRRARSRRSRSSRSSMAGGSLLSSAYQTQGTCCYVLVWCVAQGSVV